MTKYLPVLSLFLLFGCQSATQMISSFSPEKTVQEQSQPSIEISATESVEPVIVVEKPLETAVISNYQFPLDHNLPQEIGQFLVPEIRTLPYYGDFPLAQHARVEKLVKRYTGSQKVMFGRWLERAARFIPKIQMVFASEGLPLDLAYLAMIESGFNVRAYSWAHAAGPWQFIESTGRIYGLDNDWWQDGRLDLEKSTRAAAKHLKYLHKRFDGNWYLAVAAYNAGGGKVRRAIKASNSRDFWVLTEGKVLREETRNYVPKLLAALDVIKNSKKYGFDNLNYEAPLEYENITLESSTDLEIIANFCGISYKQLKDLNPELKRWCSPPGVRNYQLRVPVGSADKANQLYAQLPKDQRARYSRHKIKSGDTLQVLARKYRIRVDDIITMNGINDPRTIQIGTNLILPLKEGYTSLPANALTDSYVRSRRKTYKVRSGDSLWSIAKRFSVSQKELRVWNKLGWSNFLKPGQVLAVSKAGKRNVAHSGKKAKTGPTKKMVYHVVPGDTLWGIGRQFDVAMDQIRRWNALSNGHILRPGQKLTLLVAASRRG
jgi:peptidoglycan lytic transglycosylase D